MAHELIPVARLYFLVQVRLSDYVFFEGRRGVGKLHQFGKVIIRVYANDHLPPHFHVLSPDAEALIEISSLRIMAGSLPAQVERQALTWARANESAIGAEWNRTNPRFPIA